MLRFGRVMREYLATVQSEITAGEVGKNSEHPAPGLTAGPDKLSP